jgi:hypothetical protein
MVKFFFVFFNRVLNLIHDLLSVCHIWAVNVRHGPDNVNVTYVNALFDLQNYPHIHCKSMNKGWVRCQCSICPTRLYTVNRRIRHGPDNVKAYQISMPLLT